MKLLKCILLFSLSCLLLIPTIVSAASFVIDEQGQLMGANGIKINNVNYNVRFIDGTSMDLFNYDSTTKYSDITFTSMAEATDASEALMMQVFSENIYDKEPELIQGISHNKWGAIYTIYQIEDINTHSVRFTNIELSGNDYVSYWRTSTDWDLSDMKEITYAVWELSDNPNPAPVPEPATVILLSLGLVGVIGLKQKKLKTAYKHDIETTF